MDELSIRERISKRKLREIEKYLDIVEHIRDYGRQVKELILEYLPEEISHIPDRVREVFREFLRSKDKTLTELANLYKNIPNLEVTTRYVILCYCTIPGLTDLRIEKFLSIMRDLYKEIRQFIEWPEYKNIDSIVQAICEKYEKVNKEILQNMLIKYTHAVRKIVKAYKRDVFEWIMFKKSIRELENDLRIFFPKKMNERMRRSLKSIIRIFSHTTNIPIAVNIIRRGENSKYISIADMYTTLTTFRSGAFLIMKLDSDKVRRIELLASKGYEVTVRVQSVKGIVRSVAKLSLDPILYERGSFTIGYRYCSKNMCDNCPIRDVCIKYLNIKVK